MKKLKISFEDNVKKDKPKYKKYPRLDADRLVFENDDTIEQLQVEHIKKIKSRVLKLFLLPTVIISVLLIIGCVAFSLYTNIQIEEITVKREETLQRAERLAKQVRTLRDEIDELKENRDKSNITQQQVIQALKNKSSTSSNNNSNIISNERLCTIPDCNSRANTGSYYCSRHECMKVGCHEPKANDLCMYCETHKCDMPGCNNGKALNSYYCYSHP